jgi:hypothetical protein
MECGVKRIGSRKFLFCREGLWVVSVELGGRVTLFPPPNVSLMKDYPKGWPVVIAEVRNRKFRPYGYGVEKFYPLPKGIPDSIVEVLKDGAGGAIRWLREKERKLEEASELASRIIGTGEPLRV